MDAVRRIGCGRRCAPCRSSIEPASAARQGVFAAHQTMGVDNLLLIGRLRVPFSVAVPQSTFAPLVATTRAQ
jgi:hypothetical protein